MAVSHLWCHFALACATYDYRIFATGVVVALRALIRASGLNVHGPYTHMHVYIYTYICMHACIRAYLPTRRPDSCESRHFIYIYVYIVYIYTYITYVYICIYMYITCVCYIYVYRVHLGFVYIVHGNL